MTKADIATAFLVYSYIFKSKINELSCYSWGTAFRSGNSQCKGTGAGPVVMGVRPVEMEETGELGQSGIDFAGRSARIG